MLGFDPQALTSLTVYEDFRKEGARCFDPQALTSLTQAIQWGPGIRLFRSTGSYEPDRYGFYAYSASNEVSIHRLLRA